LDALPAGSIQNVTVRISDVVSDKQYYAALTCTDDASNPSEVSNIERFTISGNSMKERGSMIMVLILVASII
jgi:hypothetical protein